MQPISDSPGEEEVGEHELQVHLEELALEPPLPHPVHDDRLHAHHTTGTRLAMHSPNWVSFRVLTETRETNNDCHRLTGAMKKYTKAIAAIGGRIPRRSRSSSPLTVASAAGASTCARKERGIRRRVIM
jgi:hypothetical protein